MRAFLNQILVFISAGTLTDEEFDSLTIEDAAYNQATYNALKAILVARAPVSNLPTRLLRYFQSTGATVSDDATYTAKSDIYLGDAL